MEIKKTSYTAPKNSSAGGVGFLVGGVCLLLLGLLLLLLFFPLGILILIAALVVMGKGITQLGGTRPGVCPYCGAPVSVRIKLNADKCQQCKKSYKITADGLETLP